METHSKNQEDYSNSNLELKVDSNREPYVYKLLRSIKYNGIFIIISVLFPLLFIKMDAGRELFIQLTDNEQWYNNSLIAAAFHLLTLSMWCFPAVAVPLFVFLTHSNKANRQFYIDNLSEAYFNNDTESRRIGRFWAGIPFVLFNITFIWIQFGKWHTIVFVILIILVGLFWRMVKLNDRINSKLSLLGQLLMKREWLVNLAMLVFYIAVPYLLRNMDGNFEKVMLCLFYMLSMIVVFWQQYVLDERPIIVTASDIPFSANAVDFKTNLIRHYLVLVVLVLIFIALYIFMCYSMLPLITPIFVAVCISSLLIVGFELFISTQLLLARIANNFEHKLRYQVYEVAVILLCITMIYSCFAHSINNSDIRTELVLNKENVPGDNAQYEIDSYFTKWYENRLGENNIYQENDTDTSAYHVVYLISGQGGGSRAGAWFLMTMKYLEQIDSNFYQKIFSISAVSGSITGANMYIASKQFNLLGKNDTFVLQSDPNSPGKSDSVERQLNQEPILTFIKDIYSKNYLSSGILGLTISDYFLDGIRGKLGNSSRDRNYHFQNEEIEGFVRSNLFKMKPNYNDSVEIAKQYFLNDYMHNYPNPMTTNVPLFLINTTVIETGRKAIFSPVRLKGFSLFEDVYGNFRNCGTNKYRALPLITCVNQGQAFPLLNTYNQIHGTGRLGDGGLYENSGTETTMEVYQKLLNLIKSDKNNRFNKIKLVCITILNSPVKNEEVIYSNNSYLGTLQFAASNPFNGRERTAIERLNKLLNPKEFGNHPILQPKHSYSLTRALSKQTINKMYLDLINNAEFKSSFANVLKRLSQTDTGSMKSGLISTLNETHPINGVLVDSPIITQRSKVNPQVFVQTTTELQQDVAKIYQTLKNTKSRVYPMEVVNQTYGNSVRYFSADDAKYAAQICDSLNKNKPTLSSQFMLQDLSKSYPNVPKGQIEVWFGKR